MSTTLCDHGVLIDRECHACDKLIHDNVAARYFAAGAAAERARIVSHLKTCEVPFGNYGNVSLEYVADAIEAGAHEVHD